MPEDFRLLETLQGPELSVVQQEVYGNKKVWWVSDKWCLDNEYDYFVKDAKIACVPLIAGKQEPYVKTPFYALFPQLTDLVHKKFGENLSRINIQKIKPESCYDIHIDQGEYFLGVDRYSLALNQEYFFKVANQTVKINAGDLFWFNNKKPHGAFNESTNERIAVIIDVQKEK